MKDTENVKITFFSEFYGGNEPAIVFSGSSKALEKFSIFLSNLRLGNSEAIHLNEVSLFDVAINIHLCLEIRPTLLGMKRKQMSEDRFYIWGITKEIAEYFSKLIASVAKSSNPSHQYLDSDALDEVHVVVSKDEIPSNLLDVERSRKIN